MQNYKDDDVKKMLEMLKEHTGQQSEETVVPQTTESSARSDEEIKNMLKKHFSADGEVEPFEMQEDYSFDTVDFGKVDDEIITGEIDTIEEAIEEELVEDVVEEPVQDFVKEEPIEEIFDELVEETADEEPVEELIDEEPIEEAVEESIESPVDEAVEQAIEEEIEEDLVEEVVEEILEEATEEVVEEISEETIEEVIEETADEEIQEEIEEEPVAAQEIIEPELVAEEPEPTVEEPEEQINYDEVHEGQQGTVFNDFVEDFSGDLDDVVFEAEITESRAPDKQYTIFEDWQRLMKDKNYSSDEDRVIPPTSEELANSMEIARRASANTDYFSPVANTESFDAVDIALMVALGGESELNQTVGFEKIRQVVRDTKEEKAVNVTSKDTFGYCGDEYTSTTQNEKINKKYKKNKINLMVQAIGTAFLLVCLLGYEILGWVGFEFKGALDLDKHPDMHILLALQLLFLCAAISFNKFTKLFKNTFGFSSLAYMSAMILLVLNVHHDVLVLSIGYADPSMTFHSLSAFLFLLSLIYDMFELYQQSGMFGIISNEDKKLVLEPYGKLRMGADEDNDRGEIIDKDSYCISRVVSVNKFFERTAKSASSASQKLITLIISLSVSLCVMLVLLLMKRTFDTIMLSFIITLSFTLICSVIFESGFAFFAVYRALKKYKTGIIGKASVGEYGNCNIVYFDDYNVFNKKSVRTKGLKLYDNNEIYRVLYHTQAVFSKIGGPLKAVFEFATTEMVHSKNVEIKEISKEGVLAVVDNRTSVLIGTGLFMKSRGIHPKYTAADLKLEESGEESIMFIALNGVLGAKLYVTYQFSSEFEKLARKLSAKGVGIGIRSSDPNINNRWAKRYSEIKKFRISTVRPTLNDLKSQEKSIEGGVVSAKNVGALTEALMMCIKLNNFESLIAKVRTIAVILMGILSFALVLLSGIDTVCMLALMLASALCASIMMLLSHFYIKR